MSRYDEGDTRLALATDYHVLGRTEDARAVLQAGLKVDPRLHIPLALTPLPQVYPQHYLVGASTCGAAKGGEGCALPDPAVWCTFVRA